MINITETIQMLDEQIEFNEKMETYFTKEIKKRKNISRIKEIDIKLNASIPKQLNYQLKEFKKDMLFIYLLLKKEKDL